MISLVATAILASGAPSAAGLADRFVLVQQSLPGEQPMFEGWTRPQLQEELERLEDARPSIGVPIAMLVTGIVITAVDVIVFLLSGFIALVGRTAIPLTMTVGMISFGVGGAGMIIVAAMFLRAALRERAEYNKQIGPVREAIDRLQPAPRERRPPAQPINPPQNPFPAPQVQFTPPWFTVTLARF